MATALGISLSDQLRVGHVSLKVRSSSRNQQNARHLGGRLRLRRSSLQFAVLRHCAALPACGISRDNQPLALRPEAGVCMCAYMRSRA